MTVVFGVRPSSGYIPFWKIRHKQFGWTSNSKVLTLGVPLGSALSATLFNLYMAPLGDIIEACGVKAVSYADDTQ